MDDRNFEYLKEEIKTLGFPDRISEQINDYKNTDNKAFHIYYFNQIEEDQLMFDLHFTKRSNNEYQLKEYELTYKRVNISNLNIQSINVKDLDEKLKEVNSLYDRYYDGSMENSMSRQEYEQATDFIKATNNDLYKLAEIKKGEEVAKLLMYKYFPESEYEKAFPDYQEMQRRYEHKHIFPVNDNVALTATEAYQFLKAELNSVREHYTSTIASEHVLSDEAFYHINSELLKGNHWIAYNTSSYFLDRHDMYFFNSKDEANEFVEGNISEYDSYRVIKASSVDDVIKQIPYGEQRFELFAESIPNKSIENQSMLITDNNELHNQLEELGFSNKLNRAISFYESYTQERFQLPFKERNEKEAIDYWLYFEQKNNTSNYHLLKYEATLRINPDIPYTTLKGIDVEKLDKAMAQFDWSIDHHTVSVAEERMQTKTGRQELRLMESIFHGINKLHSIPEGKDIAEKLMLKYWSGGPYEPNQFSLDDLKQQYQITCTITSNMMISKTAAYEMLKSTAAERFLNQTNSITQKTNFMNQKNFDYLKDQVKFTGFGDALENDLKEKLQQRSREFQLCHDTKFGNDIVVATLNFKRSEQSDMYFFNSYNLTLKKDDSRDLMKQDFYINKGNNITLKEAYNLMDGRSVNKDLTNKEGQVYNAWVQMDFKETDKNGNYQLKHFHQNYGFNLEKELVKHPIKELTNEQDKTRLMESLQKATGNQ